MLKVAQSLLLQVLVCVLYEITDNRTSYDGAYENVDDGIFVPDERQGRCKCGEGARRDEM